MLVEHQGTDFESMISTFISLGSPPLMEDKLGDIRFIYFDTEGPLETELEIVG